jgi:hypothetical protein
VSVNRENVIWKSRDGKWYRAFYDYYNVGDTFSDDWDFEWDVEYTDDFNWVSGPHPSLEAAHRSWDGANPGGYSHYDEPCDATDRLDAKFKAYKEKPSVW